MCEKNKLPFCREGRFFFFFTFIVVALNLNLKWHTKPKMVKQNWNANCFPLSFHLGMGIAQPSSVCIAFFQASLKNGLLDNGPIHSLFLWSVYNITNEVMSSNCYSLSYGHLRLVWLSDLCKRIKFPFLGIRNSDKRKAEAGGWIMLLAVNQMKSEAPILKSPERYFITLFLRSDCYVSLAFSNLFCILRIMCLFFK